MEDESQSRKELTTGQGVGLVQIGMKELQDLCKVVV
jgi:hypothetical protein